MPTRNAWQLALEREAVIRPLAEQGRVSPTLVQDATRQLRLSRSVLYDLLRRYKQRPQTSSLLPWKRGRATKATFLESTREELLNSSIQDYLRPERPSLAALLQEVRRRFSEQDLPAPLPHASALLHHKRKHWTSPFRLLGSPGFKVPRTSRIPGFKCYKTALQPIFRDLSAA